MHWNVSELVQYITKYMTINEGDILLAGSFNSGNSSSPIMLEIGDTVHGSLLFDNKEVASVKTQVAN